MQSKFKKGDRVKITASPVGYGVIEDDRWGPELYSVQMDQHLPTKYVKPMLYGAAALQLT